MPSGGKSLWCSSLCPPTCRSSMTCLSKPSAAPVPSEKDMVKPCWRTTGSSAALTASNDAYKFPSRSFFFLAATGSTSACTSCMAAKNASRARRSSLPLPHRKQLLDLVGVQFL